MFVRRSVLAGALVACASGVAAQDFNCISPLGNVELRGDLNIAVACELSGTDVRGDVRIFAGGSLKARDVRIRGNLEARRANFIELEGSRVDRNVLLDELVGDRSRIEDSDIRGNTSLTSNRSAVEILRNEFNGNVRVIGNTGGVVISRNDIDGRLECFFNNPAPVGGQNQISRRGSGQCERLQPGSPTTPPPPTPPPNPPPTPPPGPPPGQPPAPPPPPPPDVTPPTLTLLGESTVSILIDSPYTDAGASATDNVDGNLTSQIVAASNVDTKTLGIYSVTYSVSDAAGNAATSVSRTVNVTPHPTVQEASGGGGAIGFELVLASLLAAWRALVTRIGGSYRRRLIRPIA